MLHKWYCCFLSNVFQRLRHAFLLQKNDETLQHHCAVVIWYHVLPSFQLPPFALMQVIAVAFLLCFNHLSFFYQRPFCIRSGGLYRERYRISIYLLWLCIMGKQWMSCGFLSRIFPAAAHKLSAVKLLVYVLSFSKASCTALHLFR